MSHELPAGWTGTTLGEVGRWFGGGTPSKKVSEFWSQRDLPWVSPKDVKSDWVTDAEDWISKDAVVQSSTNVVPEGGILLVTRSGILRHTLPIARCARNCAINQDIKALIVQEGFHSAYVFQYLCGFADEIRRACVKTGTTVESVDFDALKRFLVLLPPLHEQRRIAEILSSVDEAIQATQAVIEQTRKVKVGVLQRLLTRGIGHTRFKQTEIGEVPQSWRVVRIAEVATAKGGKRMPKGRPFASEPTPHPYIRVSDLKNGTIGSSNLMYVLPEDRKEIKNYTISSRDVYISIAGTIGLSGTVPSELDGAQLTENAAKIVINKQQELEHEFLASLMQSEVIQRQIVSAKGIGGGVPKLALFRIEQMFMPLPPVDEQVEILKFARAIDAEIEAQKNILSRVLSIKSALMSDLLTGRRCVSDSLPLAAE